MNFRNNGLWNGFFDRNEIEPYKVDIYEIEDQECIEMDLPGYRKENITIDYNNGYLTISAYKEEEEKNYIHQERYYGEYTRSIYVGDIKENSIKASLENGILKITYPKEENSIKERHIPID